MEPPLPSTLDTPDNEDSGSDILVSHDAAAKTAESPRKIRVLAIEDSPMHFAQIEYYLSNPGRLRLQVTHAKCLDDGLQSLRQGSIDIVLLDLNLPDSMGLETLRTTRAVAPNVPIVVLTGMDDESIAIQAVREGAEDFLIKGEFGSELLIRSIRYAIARHRSRAKLERALVATRRSEQSFRNILSRNVDGILVVDGHSVIQFANPAAQSLFGRSKAELIQRTVPIAFPEGESGELEIVRDDGQRIPLEIRTVEITWLGEPARLAILRDLSLQKQAQAEHAQLTAIVQSTENAIISADLQGNVLTWNPGAEAIFGYTTGEAIGMHVSKLWPEDQCDKAVAMIEQVKGGGKISELETVRRRKDGRQIDVALSVFPVFGETGEVVSIGGIIADISEKKRTKQELARKHFELRMAQAIQQRLLPQAAPRLPGYDIAGGLFPADFAAGDYYDFLPMDEGAAGFVVGDVSSHGLGPAMLMASTRAHLRSLARSGDSLDRILSRLNRMLIDETKDEDFVTLLFAQLDCANRSLMYTSAGHAIGYVVSTSGEVTQELPSTSLPLAILPDAEFPVRGPIQLMLGDTIVFPTDGLHEARAPDGRFLGRDRMLDVVRSNRHRTAAEIVQALRQLVCGFCQRDNPTDDLTTVVIKVMPTD